MILVAHSYFLAHEPKQIERMNPYAPLSTMICAALLRDQGYDVALYDGTLDGGVEDFEAAIARTRPALVAIMEDNFNFLTKMCTVRRRQAALEMIRAAIDYGCDVVVNGPDAVDQAALYLAAGASAVIVGEGEEGLLELARAWSSNAPLDGVAGLILPGPQGTVRYSQPRRPVQDLDALPLPAWDLVDAGAYRQAWRGAHGRFSWIMATSRGCPYDCSWCAKPIFGRRYDHRSPASVAEEMQRLKDEIAPDRIWFADDIFGLNPAWIHAFAAEVAARGARTPFMMQSRANLMRPDIVAALAEAGAEEVWLGVESGSQKILDAMDKAAQVEEARLATRRLKAHGIRACWFIQLGFPSEHWEDLIATRDLIREERPDDIGVSVAYPLPGTRFHDQVKLQLGARRNWEDTGDLAMLFQGAYDTAFYRLVRDLLHDENRRGVFDDVCWDQLAVRSLAHRSAEPVLLPL